MKKLLFVMLAFALTVVSCNGGMCKCETSANDTDSVVVDSMTVDSLVEVVDTLVAE